MTRRLAESVQPPLSRDQGQGGEGKDLLFVNMAAYLVDDSDQSTNYNDEDCELELINSMFCTKLHVSERNRGAIIGKSGSTKMRIERDTRTEIKIPRQGQTGDVAIFGYNASNVKAARKRIKIVLMSSRLQRRSFTHFLSIPTNNEIVRSNFIAILLHLRFETPQHTFELVSDSLAQWPVYLAAAPWAMGSIPIQGKHACDEQESVLRECPSEGLDESIFIRPARLHLTIGMLSLTDNEEIQQASKLLNEAKEKIIIPMLQANAPLRVRIKGLASMNDDPHNMHVLYGRVQEEDSPPGLMQNLADALVDHYNDAGYTDKWSDHVKLHVTVINSAERSRSEPEGKSRRYKREPFDGSMVLQKFGDFDFGVVEVTEIRISQLHSDGPDGYYQSSDVVSW